MDSPTVGSATPREVRIDPFLGTKVHIVGHRQSRPNLPIDSCPFCVGGLEAPEPYQVKWFSNRWPAMDGDRCEVVLYSPHHDASLSSLGTDGIAAVIELWTQRTAVNSQRPEVDYVLIFENRGAAVGATISHPHGQIYHYPHLPDRPRRRLEAKWHPDPDAGERLITEHGVWMAWVPAAPVFPCEIAIAPRTQHRSLLDLSVSDRADLAMVLGEVLSRLDAHFGTAAPYMMWLNQQPFSQRDEYRSLIDAAWFNIEIVSPWRATGVPRFIAAAEVACEEYFNPVIPEDLAAALRLIST
jgi:UDPglucose--hexose-1-phosphate uridylyltransferase